MRESGNFSDLQNKNDNKINQKTKQNKKGNSYIKKGKEISSTLFVKFQCKQVSFSFSPSTPFSLSLLSDLKGLFTTTALISFPLTHCNLAPALPIQTNSLRSQMTSFWLTWGISVSSLTFLSNLIPLITFFLAWLLWQYPLVAFHHPSLLLFQHLLQQLLLPSSWDSLKATTDSVFSLYTFFSCFLL